MERKAVMEVNHLRLMAGKRMLCEDVSFALYPGDCALLSGANGSGKTTLLLHLATLPGVTLIPTGIPKVQGFTLLEFVRTACYRESNWAGRLNAEAEARLQEALQQLGLWEKREQDIASLSDGEFQKACLAVGLSRQSRVLLLDEPTAFLDVEGRLMLLKTLREVASRTGTAVLFSSHDLHESQEVATRHFCFTPQQTFIER